MPNETIRLTTLNQLIADWTWELATETFSNLSEAQQEFKQEFEQEFQQGFEQEDAIIRVYEGFKEYVDTNQSELLIRREEDTGVRVWEYWQRNCQNFFKSKTTLEAISSLCNVFDVIQILMIHDDDKNLDNKRRTLVSKFILSLRSYLEGYINFGNGYSDEDLKHWYLELLQPDDSSDAVKESNYILFKQKIAECLQGLKDSNNAKEKVLERCFDLFLDSNLPDAISCSLEINIKNRKNDLLKDLTKTIKEKLKKKLKELEEELKREKTIQDFFFDHIMRERLPDFGLLRKADSLDGKALKIISQEFKTKKERWEVFSAIIRVFLHTRCMMFPLIGPYKRMVAHFFALLLPYIQGNTTIESELYEYYADLLMLSGYKIEQIRAKFDQFVRDIIPYLEGIRKSATKEDIIKYCCLIFSHFTLRPALFLNTEGQGHLLDALIEAMKYYLLRDGETDIFIPQPDSDQPYHITSMSMFAWLLDVKHEGFLTVLRNTANIRMEQDVWMVRHEESERISYALLMRLDKLIEDAVPNGANADLYLLKLVDNIRVIFAKIPVLPNNATDSATGKLSKDELSYAIKNIDPLVMEQLRLIQKLRQVRYKGRLVSIGGLAYEEKFYETAGKVLLVLEQACYKLLMILFYYNNFLKRVSIEQLNQPANGGDKEELRKILEDDKELYKKLMGGLANLRNKLNPNIVRAVGEVARIKQEISDKMKQHYAKVRDEWKKLRVLGQGIEKKMVSMPTFLKEMDEKFELSMETEEQEWLRLLNHETQHFIAFIKEDPVIEEIFVSMFGSKRECDKVIKTLEESMSIVAEDVFKDWIFNTPTTTMIEAVQQERLKLPAGPIGYEKLINEELNRLGMRDPVQNSADKFSAMQSVRENSSTTTEVAQQKRLKLPPEPMSHEQLKDKELNSSGAGVFISPVVMPSTTEATQLNFERAIDEASKQLEMRDPMQNSGAKVSALHSVSGNSSTTFHHAPKERDVTSAEAVTPGEWFVSRRKKSI